GVADEVQHHTMRLRAGRNRRSPLFCRSEAVNSFWERSCSTSNTLQVEAKAFCWARHGHKLSCRCVKALSEYATPHQDIGFAALISGNDSSPLIFVGAP